MSSAGGAGMPRFLTVLTATNAAARLLAPFIADPGVPLLQGWV